ncbi:hypothetical protein Nepgr_004757 [Nepenthes gracilis]|uniref:Uncharacterized protein n=1 Tax=Nepenthes gracilis TaxID=150966 RepID=A0AAD3S1U6_NEPGR|nr:hypothetical protein Nepgr_004757 [Nepenthes gracilis]
MASSANKRTRYHARSISWPSRYHPLICQFDEHLCRLSSSDATLTSSLLINHKLNCLKGLYDCIDELLLLNSNQQALSQGCCTKWVDGLLDASLRLLDACDTARDALQQMKERVQGIQAVLRRRCSGESSIANEVVDCISTRKKMKKTIKKCLKDIKSITCISRDERIVENIPMVGVLRDAEAITADVLESLLSYMVGQKSQSSKGSWFLFSKVTHQNLAFNNDKAADTVEFKDVDDAMHSLASNMKRSGINVAQAETWRSQMMKLESDIQDLDELLECLFRRLVNARASLLNILSS